MESLELAVGGKKADRPAVGRPKRESPASGVHQSHHIGCAEGPEPGDVAVLRYSYKNDPPSVGRNGGPGHASESGALGWEFAESNRSWIGRLVAKPRTGGKRKDRRQDSRSDPGGWMVHRRCVDWSGSRFRVTRH